MKDSVTGMVRRSWIKAGKQGIEMKDTHTHTHTMTDIFVDFNYG